MQSFKIYYKVMSSSFLHYSMYFLFSLRSSQVPEVCEKQVFQAAHFKKKFFLFEAHLQFFPSWFNAWFCI